MCLTGVSGRCGKVLNRCGGLSTGVGGVGRF